ncbi:MAG: hypothetical protein ACXW32_05620 [Limisphaerales bacterium]
MEQRPKDIIDHVEAIAADAGNVAALDDDYFETLINLSDEQFEKLVLAMMLDREAEVKRISCGKVDKGSIEEVTRFLHKGINVIGLGLMMFGPFGTLQMYARVGGPSSGRLEDKVQSAIHKRLPLVRRTVTANLIWILSREDGSFRPSAQPRAQKRRGARRESMNGQQELDLGSSD